MYTQFGVVCIAALESGNDESKARIDYVTQVQKTPGRRIKDKIHTPGPGLPKKTGEILTIALRTAGKWLGEAREITECEQTVV